MISENGSGKKDDLENADAVGDSEEKTFLTADSFESMDWWTGLADLDRINILSAPLEYRARLLASKYSSTL